jgi:hypothetical protein
MACAKLSSKGVKVLTLVAIGNAGRGVQWDSEIKHRPSGKACASA